MLVVDDLAKVDQIELEEGTHGCVIALHDELVNGLDQGVQVVIYFVALFQLNE